MMRIKFSFRLSTLIVAVTLLTALASWVLTGQARRYNSYKVLRNCGASFVYGYEVDGSGEAIPQAVEPPSIGRAILRSRYVPDVYKLSIKNAECEALCEHLNTCSEVSELSAVDCGIDDSSLAPLGLLSHLMMLDLTGNPIHNLPQVTPNVQGILVDDTRIDSDALTAVPNMSALVLFSAEGSLLDDRCAEILGRCTNLKALRLGRTKITDRSLATLRAIHGLEYLSLRHTSITSAGLAQLADLKDMTGLDLCHSNVDNEALETLKGFPKLTFLVVEGTNVTSEGEHALQRDRPRIAIDFCERGVEQSLVPGY